MLQTELSKHLGRPVAVGTRESHQRREPVELGQAACSGQEAGQEAEEAGRVVDKASAESSAARSPAAIRWETSVEASDCLVVILTKSTLHDPSCLWALVRALDAGKVIVPVLLVGRGYDFAANALLLSDLRAGLTAKELASLRLLLEGAPERGRASAGDRLEEVQGKLRASIPNLIAISWDPAGGSNQLSAVVESIAGKASMLSRRGKLYCAILYHAMLYYIIPLCNMLCYAILYYNIMHCTVLYCTIL